MVETSSACAVITGQRTAFSSNADLVHSSEGHLPAAAAGRAASRRARAEPRAASGTVTAGMRNHWKPHVIKKIYIVTVSL